MNARSHEMIKEEGLHGNIGQAPSPSKPKRWLFGAAAIVFFLSMAVVAVYNSLYQVLEGASRSATLIGMAAYIAISAGLFFLMKKFDSFISKWCGAFFTALVVFFLTLSIAFGLIMRFNPVFDLGAIYRGSIGMLENGSCLEQLPGTCDINYFYYFPNNLGGLAANYLALFVTSMFGIKDYFAVLVVVNSLFASLSLLCIGLCVRRAFGNRQGVFAMLIAILFPSYLFAAGTIYTDAMTICCPILTLFLYMELVCANSSKKRIILTVLFAVAACIGTLIKATVMIMPIAIVICDVVASVGKRKLAGLMRPLSAALATVIIFAGMSTALRSAFYANQLDQGKAEELETPKLHWVMMGLRGNGQYNSADYEFTRSFADPIERDEAVKNEVIRRINSLGICGMLKLGAKKVSLLYSDGTFCETDYFSLSPAKVTDVHKYAMTGGEHNLAYRSICNGEFFAIILLAAVGGAMTIAAFIKKSVFLPPERILATVVPFVAIIGLNLFIACWEVSVRYSMNYLPVILMSASVAFCLAENVFGKAKQRRNQ